MNGNRCLQVYLGLLLFTCGSCSKDSASPAAPSATYPDIALTIQGTFTVTSGTYVEGQVLNYAISGARLANVGDATADTVTLASVLSVNTTPTMDDIVLTTTTFSPFSTTIAYEGHLVPGVPQVPIGIPPGSYYFGMVAVVQGSRPEVRTSNNGVIAAGTVTIN
jgi:hypothetical protein